MLALGTSVYTASMIAAALITKTEIKEIELFYIHVHKFVYKSVFCKIGILPLGSSISFIDENLSKVKWPVKLLLFSSCLITTGVIGIFLYQGNFIHFTSQYLQSLISPKAVGAQNLNWVINNTMPDPLNILGGVFLSLFLINSIPIYISNGGQIIGLFIGRYFPDWIKTAYLYFGVLVAIILFGTHLTILYFWIMD
jgi:hypothetical protein